MRHKGTDIYTSHIGNNLDFPIGSHIGKERKNSAGKRSFISFAAALTYGKTHAVFLFDFQCAFLKREQQHTRFAVAFAALSAAEKSAIFFQRCLVSDNSVGLGIESFVSAFHFKHFQSFIVQLLYNNSYKNVQFYY